MKLLVGLGNPGPSYLLNRHNIGFLIIDMIAHDYGFSDFKAKGKALISEGMIGTQKCLLIKPMSFMNNSGIPTADIASFYKIPLADIFVFHDELDIDFGKMRCKVGGGAGGHNGLRSLDAHVGQDYCRIRLGIGHPGDKERVTGHVLGNFTSAEMDDLPDILGPVSDHLGLLLAGDMQKFQTAVAKDVQDAFKD